MAIFYSSLAPEITPKKRSLPFNYISTLLAIVLLLFATVIEAQNKRPKIGLVLSGGGAKGIAHIGVLKALEEAGITPDYITGTSMGSIIGGLYAAGYTADQLEEIIKEIDWDLTLTNKLPLDKVTFEEKFYNGRYLLDFYVKDKKLILPEGVIEGQALIQQFCKLTLPVNGIEDFNDFPIPFACVATNIATGEPVVLNKGSLSNSLRASMAIPTIFTPVTIDDQLLVDGGLVRNMPVPEVQDMGAEFIIGVFVSSDFHPKEELTSAISILSQSAFITSVYDTRQQLGKCDILITPDLAAYSTGSFHEAKGILEKGNEAGKEYLEVFKKLADSLNQLGPAKVFEPLERHPAIVDNFTFSDIQIEGNEIVSDGFIEGKLNFESNKTVKIEQLQEKIDLLYGTQYFSKIGYEILDSPDGNILKINIIERPREHFRFSYHYDTENKGGILANATFRNLILNNSRLIFEADLSTQPSALINYFKYLGGKQNFAFAASGIFNNKDLPLYNEADGEKNQVYGSNFLSGALKLQSTRAQNSTYGIEAEWMFNEITPKIADLNNLSVTKINYRNTALSLFFRHNSLNDRYFPTKGLKANVVLSSSVNINGSLELIIDSVKTKIDASESGGVIQTSNINSVLLEIMPLIPIGSKFTLITKAKVSISNLENGTVNLNELDFIGGFIPGLVNANEFYGASPKEYVTANYFYGRVTGQYMLKRNLFLQAHFNYLNSMYPSQWVLNDFTPTSLGGRTDRIGYGASIGYKSIIGPIFFSVAQDLHRHNLKAALSIGFFY